MGWTKQHFVLVANVLKKTLPNNTDEPYAIEDEVVVEETVNELADNFSEIFKSLNPNFDETRFIKSIFN